MTTNTPRTEPQATTWFQKMVTGGSRIYLFAVLVSFAFPVAAEVVIYPGHKPGDLAQFTNLWESQRYAVSVNGKPLTVYASKNRTGKFIDKQGRNAGVKPGYIKEAHFCYFSFKDKTVNIVISSPNGAANLSQATVHPVRHNIPCQVVGGKASFKLTSPRKIVIKTIDDELFPLIILADEPDKDIPSGPNVTRYGPGIHDIGLKSPVHRDQTIYIDGGAIVKGTFFSNDKPLKGFTLRGRGILYAGDYEYIYGDGSRHILPYGVDDSLIEGCLLVDSPNHNVLANNNSTAENLKIISFHGTTDGVHFGPYSTCRDCFVMCNDDVLLAHITGNPDKKSWELFENCVVWHHDWGSPFKIIGGPQHDITFRNIDIIETGTRHAVFLGQWGGGGDVYNYVFENIHIERMRPYVKLFDLKPGMGTNRKMYNMTFRNIYAPTAIGTIKGASDSSYIDGIVFDNVVINGKKIKTIEETGIKVGEHVRNLTVK